LHAFNLSTKAATEDNCAWNRQVNDAMSITNR
jgi:hypothetical protein